MVRSVSLYNLCRKVGIPPSIWMIPSPFKIYEFTEVVKGAGLGRDQSVLDLGCGKGHWTMMLARSCRMATGLDVNPAKIAIARQFVRNSPLKSRVQFRCSTLEDAGFPSGCFDHVFSFCVLEHIANLGEVLGEVARVLRPGGRLHVSVDSLQSIKSSEQLAKHKAEHSVVQYFCEDTLRQQFLAAGLDAYHVYPILTGEGARQEFLMRISRGSRYNLVERLLLCRRFMQEDRRVPVTEGLMVVAHGARPVESAVPTQLTSSR